MHGLAQRQAKNGCQEAQHQIFPQDIGRSLPGIEAQHLHRGDFPAAFRQIDIRQIVDDDKGQGPGKADDQPDDVIQAAHGAVHLVQQHIHAAQGGDSVQLRQCLGDLVQIAGGLEHCRIKALVAKALPAGVPLNEEIIAHIVFKHAGHPEGHPVQVAVLHLDGCRAARRQPHPAWQPLPVYSPPP